MRLDALLVHRGLVESRERARALILAGKVDVPGLQSLKAGTLVPIDADLRVAEPEHPWVSRGGVKLAHALDAFHIDVNGRLGLDIGASTGGFTDVLLQRGARHVIAVDVGHNQLHWKIRSDARVTVIEGLNARALSAADLPGLGDGAGIVTVDVSFISLRLILPVIPPLLAPGADVVVLVKPQFEAGRDDIERGGLVTDPTVHARVIDEVTAAAARIGLTRVAMVESPITGAEGNREFLMHLTSEASPTTREAPSPTTREAPNPSRREAPSPTSPKGESHEARSAEPYEPRSGESHEARSAEPYEPRSGES
jgi:23S rRNA (cytidine1920-2'-O)/16S rRNA (cytidine1409-2'-O)-methyltransferase